MTRRFGHGRRRTGAVSLFDRVRALLAGREYFTATGHITLSGTGDVLSIHGWTDDTSVLTQSDTTKQVDPPAFHADFAGLCLNFTGAEFYDGNRPASAYSNLRDGVSAEPYVVCTPLSALAKQMVSTIHPTSNNNGFRLGHSSGGGLVLVQEAIVGSGANVVNDAGTVTVSVGSPTYFGYSMAAGAVTRYVKSASGALAVTPPFSSSGGAPLRLGGATNGAALSVMRWAELPLFPALDASGRATWQQYVQQILGIAP